MTYIYSDDPELARQASMFDDLYLYFTGDDTYSPLFNHHVNTCQDLRMVYSLSREGEYGQCAGGE